MKIEELAVAYRKDEETLKNQIREHRKLLRNSKGAQLHTERRNLICLYEMLQEVQNTAKTLENYYTDKSKTTVYHKKTDIFKV